jgi:iron-sulfur cluster repair protein YtfE (RIC family)
VLRLAVLSDLEKEHNEVLQKLGLLGLTVQSFETIEAEHSKQIEDGRKLLNFIDEKIIPHFQMEETILFPTLERLTSIDKGLILSYRVEHKKILAEVEEFKKIVSSQSGDFGIIKDQIVKDIMAHATRENEELIPLTRKLITEEQAEQLDKILTDKKAFKNTH